MAVAHELPPYPMEHTHTPDAQVPCAVQAGTQAGEAQSGPVKLGWHEHRPEDGLHVPWLELEQLLGHGVDWDGRPKKVTSLTDTLFQLSAADFQAGCMSRERKRRWRLGRETLREAWAAETTVERDTGVHHRIEIDVDEEGD